MKKLTLALLLIVALCMMAVTPVLAADPYTNSVGNVSAKFIYGISGKNVVSFPTATYRPSIAKTLDTTFALPTYVPSIAKTTTAVFTVPAISSIRTSVGGYPYVAKFPWEL